MQLQKLQQKKMKKKNKKKLINFMQQYLITRQTI